MPENRDAWELVLACQTQLRATMGGILGFDYAAVRWVAGILGVDMTPAMLKKLRAIETELVKKAGNNGDS